LKQAVCVMNHRECERCLVANQCIYPYVFETPAPPGLPLLHQQKDAPHPFVLDPPVYPRPSRESEDADRPPREKHHLLAAGDEIAFGLTLMGRAIEYLPYLVYAVQGMAERGLGKGRAPFALSEVSLIEVAGRPRVIYTETSQRLEGAEGTGQDLSVWISDRLARARPLRGPEGIVRAGAAGGPEGREGEAPPAAHSGVDGDQELRLRFITPTRIKSLDDLQPQADFALLIRSLMRRLSMLLAVHGERRLELDFRGLLERAAAVGTRSSSLRWWDWSRYSDRQQTRMRLGGFVGEIFYEGRTLTEFLPILMAGEILRIGNGTSFGLGRYELL
jgi:hypothetical protein